MKLGKLTFILFIALVLIGVLGVLVISSEYSTGMIRTTLTTNPHRGVMIAAKGVVFTVVALVTSLVTSFAAFFVGQALMSSDHISTTIGSPNVLRAVIGGLGDRRNRVSLVRGVGNG